MSIEEKELVFNVDVIFFHSVTENLEFFQKLLLLVNLLVIDIMINSLLILQCIQYRIESYRVDDVDTKDLYVELVCFEGKLKK